MRADDSKKKSRPARRTPSQGFYVYCVGERDALSALIGGELPDAIEADSGLEMVSAGGLAGIVSSVPLADYGEEALPARLKDPGWTALRVMRHEKVIEHFASSASVIPLRFGTIYLRRGRIEQMLGEKRDELRGIIGRLRGRDEWGVNVYLARAKLMRAVSSLSPRLQEISEQAASAPPGRAYLMRKKIEAMRADEARAEIRRVTAEVEAELSRISDGAVRLRVMKDEADECGEVAARLTFLVERTRFKEFRAAAEALADRHEAAGFKLELTGPWPAYNFAG
ncbi:MAG: GvpL/GvpF family gas vesicle protein [Blastocatellia bacterium]